MHIKFKKETKCEFPATTFKAGKTYSIPDHIALPFVDAKKAEKVASSTPKVTSQPLTPDPETPDSK